MPAAKPFNDASVTCKVTGCDGPGAPTVEEHTISWLPRTLELRGPLAYVLGHRYLFLEKKPEAVEFFCTALKDASTDSPLRRLAQAELDRLSGK